MSRKLGSVHIIMGIINKNLTTNKNRSWEKLQKKIGIFTNIGKYIMCVKMVKSFTTQASSNGYTCFYLRLKSNLQ